MSDELFKAMAQSVIDGEPEQAEELARRAIEEGISPLDALDKGFVPGIATVGKLFSSGEYFLPDLVLGGEAMKAALEVLEPELSRKGEERQVLGKVVLGTVQGDIHEIGKSLVGTMLTANGFEVYDLGVDVSAQRFVDKVKVVGANLVGLSALLTTTMVVQKQVIEALQESGIREQVKVMVGGAPVTQSWASEIGADGYSEDAAGAVIKAKELVGVL
jgi:corrinoid protein of di/trimethylamine methyltransferase